MRLPVATARCTPVYAGWQFEQTSTNNASAVERTLNVVPHVAQATSMSWV
jgi:hypothetical protein